MGTYNSFISSILQESMGTYSSFVSPKTDVAAADLAL
jgi:hypothetical protein